MRTRRRRHTGLLLTLGVVLLGVGILCGIIGWALNDGASMGQYPGDPFLMVAYPTFPTGLVMLLVVLFRAGNKLDESKTSEQVSS